MLCIVKMFQISIRWVVVLWLIQKSQMKKSVDKSDENLKENVNKEKLLAKYVCFEAKGNKYGKIIIQIQGLFKLTRIKLVHKSGKVTHDGGWTNTFWGGVHGLGTVITTKSNKIICPDKPVDAYGWYTLPGYNPMSPYLIFENINIKVNYSVELRLWYGEDLKDSTEYDNSGQSCSEVFGEYQDVNECLDKTDGCSQFCINTIGSYKCSCRKGFHLTADQRTCEEDYYEVHVRPPPEWFHEEL